MAKGASVDINVLNREIKKGKNVKGLMRAIRDGARPELAALEDKARKYILELFNNHPITKEIDSGNQATNLSNTLGGVGNLFTYIGFEEGSKPTDIIRKYLSDPNVVKFKDIQAIKPGGGSRTLKFDMIWLIPSILDVEAMSPVPWSPGMSWVDAMERGLSGLGNYLVKRPLGMDKPDFKTSRSGGALQIKAQLRSGQFQPKPYFSAMLVALTEWLKAGATGQGTYLGR